MTVVWDIHFVSVSVIVQWSLFWVAWFWIPISRCFHDTSFCDTSEYQISRKNVISSALFCSSEVASNVQELALTA